VRQWIESWRLSPMKKSPIVNLRNPTRKPDWQT
jgi:hypothetical protein